LVNPVLVVLEASGATGLAPHVATQASSASFGPAKPVHVTRQAASAATAAGHVRERILDRMMSSALCQPLFIIAPKRREYLCHRLFGQAQKWTEFADYLWATAKTRRDSSLRGGVSQETGRENSRAAR
jgi:hypothetical protein